MVSYSIICVPTPAEFGLNEFPETPVPDHIPPEGIAERVTGGPLMNNVPGDWMVITGTGITVMIVLSESLQSVLTILYFIL